MDNRPSEDWLRNHFKCNQCQECCKQPGFVYLKDGEAEKIAAFLNVDLYEFTDQYCDVLDRKRLVLKKQPNEVCVFLEPDGCRIHDEKPVQCKNFPYEWMTDRSFEYCEGLKEIL